jgi:hypothetical protein
VNTPTLEELNVISLASGNLRMTGFEVDQVRALGHLRKVSMAPYMHNVLNMRDIVATPHSLQWQEVDFVHDLAIAQCLVALPSLTKLSGKTIALEPFILAKLPNLIHLVLDSPYNLDQQLRACPSLTELNVCHWGVANLEWADASPHLHTSLQKLTLRGWGMGAHIASSQLMHLVKFQNLRELTLSRIPLGRDVTDSVEFASLKPPTAAMPALQTLTLI